METLVVIRGVIALFLMMLIGVYGSKRHIITVEVNKGLTQVLLKITIPLLIIASFNFTYDEGLKANVLRSFYYSAITLVICAVVSYIVLLPLKKKDKYILQFANVFSNCGFMGFPLIASIYGNEGVIYTSVFNMLFNIFVWTYGVSLFTGKITKSEFKKVMLSPAVVAVYIGMGLMIFDLQLPEVILSPMKTVGGMTSPLSMLIVGAILANVPIKGYLKDWTIYYGAVIKLIVLPLIIYGIVMFVGISSTVANTMILLTAMPAAAMTSIFAENHDQDKEYASVVVFLTTLLSIGTFPMILHFIK